MSRRDGFDARLDAAARASRPRLPEGILEQIEQRRLREQRTLRRRRTALRVAALLVVAVSLRTFVFGPDEAARSPGLLGDEALAAAADRDQANFIHDSIQRLAAAR